MKFALAALLLAALGFGLGSGDSLAANQGKQSKAAPATNVTRTASTPKRLPSAKSPVKSPSQASGKAAPANRAGVARQAAPTRAAAAPRGKAAAANARKGAAGRASAGARPVAEKVRGSGQPIGREAFSLNELPPRQAADKARFPVLPPPTPRQRVVIAPPAMGAAAAAGVQGGSVQGAEPVPARVPVDAAPVRPAAVPVLFPVQSSGELSAAEAAAAAAAAVSAPRAQAEPQPPMAPAPAIPSAGTLSGGPGSAAGPSVGLPLGVQTPTPARPSRGVARAYAMDGATFYQNGRKIRIQGLDARDPGMTSEHATQRLQRALDSGSLTVEPQDTDPAGHMVAVVRVNGRNLADALRASDQ